MIMADNPAFPAETKVKSHQEIFCQKFEEIFLSKRKKCESLLAKAKKNALDVPDSSRIQSTPSSGVQQSDNESISSENSTMSEFYDMTLGRKKKDKARKIYRTLSSVGEDSIGSVMKTIARELSIAFEYQLALLDGSTEIKKAANFAVRAIMHYLKNPDAVFTDRALIQAVLEDKVKGTWFTGETSLKTSFPEHSGYRGIQWTVDGMFREPGIRWADENLPENANSDIQPTLRFSGSFTPFGATCRPDLYGYRAPLHVRDPETGSWGLIQRDRTTLYRLNQMKEFSTRRERGDVHQIYIPFSSCSHAN